MQMLLLIHFRIFNTCWGNNSNYFSKYVFWSSNWIARPKWVLAYYSLIPITKNCVQIFPYTTPIFGGNTRYHRNPPLFCRKKGDVLYLCVWTRQFSDLHDCSVIFTYLSRATPSTSKWGAIWKALAYIADCIGCLTSSLSVSNVFTVNRLQVMNFRPLEFYYHCLTLLLFINFYENTSFTLKVGNTDFSTLFLHFYSVIMWGEKGAFEVELSST